MRFSPHHNCIQEVLSIHIVQMSKLRCIGAKKQAQLHTGSTHLSWVPNHSRGMPQGTILRIPFLLLHQGFTPKFTQGWWGITRIEKSGSMGKEKLKGYCCRALIIYNQGKESAWKASKLSTDPEYCLKLTIRMDRAVNKPSQWLQ